MTTPLHAISLPTLPHHVRLAARWFLIVLLIGYTAGLVFVAHTTSMTIHGVQERYRGNQDSTASVTATAPADTAVSASASAASEQPEMKFEKSYEEMLNITHTHILAMVAFLFPVACIFAFARRPSRRMKSVLIVEPFVALVVSFSAMWLMRYVHPAFSYLLMASSISFAICLYAMIGVSLRELFTRPSAGSEVTDEA